MGRFYLLLLAQVFIGLVYSYGNIPVPTQPVVDTYNTVPTYDTDYDYSSIKLDVTDPCTPNPCLNMGSCVSSQDVNNPGFWCLCNGPFFGDFCEKIVQTTTTTTTPRPTTTMMTRRIPIKKVPTQTGYSQQMPMIFRDTTTTTTTTPMPFVPPSSYNQPMVPVRQPIRQILRDTTPTPTYQQQTVFRPQTPPVQTLGYNQRTLMDLTPTVTAGCLANPCLNDGTCNDLGNNQFFCTCPWGWSGPKCEICITDCASNPCPSNKRCRARYGGGFDCVCPPDRTGLNCEIQNDVCSANQCVNGGTCKPTGGDTFTCICRDGFSGVNCEQRWANPCTEDVLRNTFVMQFECPWDRTSYIICADINVWVQMPCSNGTYFNKLMGQCVPEGFEKPMCPEGLCLNDADCLLDARGQLTCSCKPGYTGTNCEIDIDECAFNGNACSGGLCVDQINTYYCICPRGVGLDCVNTIPDPCTSDNIDPETAYFTIPSLNGDHFLHCTSLGLWQVRKCADGLFWAQEEKTCTMDRPKPKTGVCTTFPCKNGGECLDFGSSQFSCKCKEGYTGQLCETVIDYCLSNPCQNGGRCLSYAGGYTCVCPDKIIDECCCTGVPNPCPDRSKLVPGLNNYFPHLMPNRYIHCDFDGRAFVRTCAPSTRWIQSVLSCLSDEQMNITFTAVTTTPAPVLRDFPVLQPTYQQSSYQQPSYQQPMVFPTTTTTTTTQRPILRDFVVPSYQQPMFFPTTTTTTPRPILRDFVAPSYSYQQPMVFPTTTTTTPRPILRDFPVVQPTYQQSSYQQPMVFPTTTTTTTTPRPILRDFVAPSYSYQQPMVFPTTTTTTTTPRPILRDFVAPSYSYQQPMVFPTTTTQRPILRDFPVVQPTYQQSSYQQPTPAPVNTDSYGDYTYDYDYELARTGRVASKPVQRTQSVGRVAETPNVVRPIQQGRNVVGNQQFRNNMQ